MPPDNVRPSDGKQLVVSSGYGNNKVITGVPETRGGHDENTRQASISLDQLLESLLEQLSEITIPGHRAPLSDLLTPLLSHRWFSSGNYQRVGKWGVGALAVVGQAREGGPSQQTLLFLVTSMFDQYHYDRALYGASHLADHPDPERVDYSRTTYRNGHTYLLYTQDLTGIRDLPREVTDRVAELAVLALPDDFVFAHDVRYEPYNTASQRYVNPNISTLINPIVYARYHDWFIKVAELDGIPEDGGSH